MDMVVGVHIGPANGDGCVIVSVAPRAALPDSTSGLQAVMVEL